MKNRLKKFTALMTSIIMLLTIIPIDRYVFATGSDPPHKVEENVDTSSTSLELLDKTQIPENGEIVPGENTGDDGSKILSDDGQNSNDKEQTQGSESEKGKEETLPSETNKDDDKNAVDRKEENKADDKNAVDRKEENKADDKNAVDSKEGNKADDKNSANSEMAKDKTRQDLNNKESSQGLDAASDKNKEAETLPDSENSDNQEIKKDNSNFPMLNPDLPKELLNPELNKKPFGGELFEKSPEDILKNILYAETPPASQNDDKLVSMYVEWISKSEAGKEQVYVVSDDGLTIDIYPKENQVYIPTFRVYIENKINLPKNSVVLTVPKYMFMTRYEENDIVNDYNMNWKAIYSTNINTDGIIGYQYDWLVPKSPAESRSGLNYEETQDGKYFITKNYKERAMGTSMQFTMGYKFLPTVLKTDEHGVYEHTENIVMEYNGQKTTKPLTVRVHTEIKPTKFEVKQGNISGKIDPVYFAWNPVWGTEPPKDPGKKYYYIPWFLDVTRDKNTTSAYNISVKDITSNEDTSDDGEIVGVARYSITSRNPKENPNIQDPIIYSYINPSKLDEETDGNLKNIANNDKDAVMGEKPAIFAKFFVRDMDKPVANSVNFYTQWSRVTDNGNAIRYVILKRYELDSKKKDALKLGKTVEIKNKFQLTVIPPVGEKIIINSNNDDGNKAVIRKIVEENGTPDFIKTTNNNSTIKKYTITRDMLLMGFPVFFDSDNGKGKNLYTTRSYGRNKLATNQYNIDVQRYNMPYEIETIEDKGYFYKSNTENWTIKATETVTNNNLNTDPIQMEDGDYYIKSINPKITEHEAGEDAFGDFVTSDKVSIQYDRYKPLEIYVKTLDSPNYKLYGRLVTGIDGNVQFEMEPGFSVSNPWDKTTLILPDKTTGIKYKHKSDFFESRVIVDSYIEMQPTEHVKEIMKDCQEKELKTYFFHSGEMNININDEKVKSYNTDYTKIVSILSQMTDANVERYVSKNSGDTEIENSVQYKKVFIIMAAKYGGGWLYKSQLNKMIKKYLPKSFKIYDLLPKGTYVTRDETGYPKVEIGTSNNNGTFKEDYGKKLVIERKDYDIYFEDDWEKSGQTMMIIDVHKFDESLLRPSEGDINIGIVYTLANSYTNISNYGHVVKNTVAAVNTDPDSPWSSPGWNSIGVASIGEKRKYFQPIYDEYKMKACFNAHDMNYKEVTETSSGGEIDISNSENPDEYKKINHTYLNGEYNYRINYSANKGDYTTNLAIYDNLQADGSQWKGRLKSININSIMDLIKNKDINLKIYYSTNITEKIDKENIEKYRVDNLANVAEYWTKLEFDINKIKDGKIEIPEDIATKIKAIAIDLSEDNAGNKVILPQGENVSVKLSMLSPKTAKTGEKEVNSSTIVYKLSNNSEMDMGVKEQYSEVKATVTIKDLSLKIVKNSNPVSGIKTNPTNLKEKRDIEYTINITNNDNSKPVKNIKILEKNIALNPYNPSSGENYHLFTDLLDIQAVNENGDKKLINPRMEDYSENDQTKKGLFINIDQINAGETIIITIKAKVKIDENAKETIPIDNTAVIKYIGEADVQSLVKEEDYKKDYQSSTYHKVVKTIEPIEVVSNWDEKYANIAHPGIKVIKIDENADKIELKEGLNIITTATKSGGKWTADNGFAVNYNEKENALVFTNSNYKNETVITAIQYLGKYSTDSINSEKNQSLVYDTIAPEKPVIKAENGSDKIFSGEDSFKIAIDNKDIVKIKKLENGDFYTLKLNIGTEEKTVKLEKDSDTGKIKASAENSENINPSFEDNNLIIQFTGNKKLSENEEIKAILTDQHQNSSEYAKMKVINLNSPVITPDKSGEGHADTDAKFDGKINADHTNIIISNIDKYADIIEITTVDDETRRKLIILEKSNSGDWTIKNSEPINGLAVVKDSNGNIKLQAVRGSDAEKLLNNDNILGQNIVATASNSANYNVTKKDSNILRYDTRVDKPSLTIARKVKDNKVEGSITVSAINTDVDYIDVTIGKDKIRFTKDTDENWKTDKDLPYGLTIDKTDKENIVLNYPKDASLFDGVEVSARQVDKNGNKEDSEKKKLDTKTDVQRDEKEITEGKIERYVGETVTESEIVSEIKINPEDKISRKIQSINVKDKNILTTITDEKGEKQVPVTVTYKDGSTKETRVTVDVYQKIFVAPNTIVNNPNKNYVINGSDIQKITFTPEALTGFGKDKQTFTEKIKSTQISNNTTISDKNAADLNITDGNVTGTPLIKDWMKGEETRDITITNTRIYNKETKEENGQYKDEEDVEKTVSTNITVIRPLNVTPEDQTLTVGEKRQVEITKTNLSNTSEYTVDTENLPPELKGADFTKDENGNLIMTVTPNADGWKEDEKEKTVKVKVTVTTPKGQTETVEVNITIKLIEIAKKPEIKPGESGKGHADTDTRFLGKINADHANVVITEIDKNADRLEIFGKETNSVLKLEKQKDGNWKVEGENPEKIEILTDKNSGNPIVTVKAPLDSKINKELNDNIKNPQNVLGQDIKVVATNSKNPANSEIKQQSNILRYDTRVNQIEITITNETKAQSDITIENIDKDADNVKLTIGNESIVFTKDKDSNWKTDKNLQITTKDGKINIKLASKNIDGKEILAVQTDKNGNISTPSPIKLPSSPEIKSNWIEKYANIKHPEIKVTNIEENTTKVEIKNIKDEVIATATKDERGNWISKDKTKYNVKPEQNSLIFVPTEVKSGDFHTEDTLTATKTSKVMEDEKGYTTDSEESKQNQRLVYDTIAPEAPENIKIDKNQVEIKLSKTDIEKIKKLGETEKYRLTVEASGEEKILDITKSTDTSKDLTVQFTKDIPENQKITAYLEDQHQNIGDKKSVITITTVKPIPKPEVEKITIYKGDKINSADGIKDPEKYEKIEVIEEADNQKVGNQTSKVKVTNKDGSTIIVKVPVEVKDRVPWTETTPIPEVKPVDITIYKGEKLDYKKGLPDLPEGATFEVIESADNNQIGKQIAKVKVKFKDGSTRTVNVNVYVLLRWTEIKPIPKPEVEKITIYKGDKINSADGIKDPEKYEKIEVIKEADNQKLGNQTSKVKVTNKDGSTIIVKVPVEVKDRVPWTEIKPIPKPEVEKITIYKGDKINSADGIKDPEKYKKIEVIKEADNQKVGNQTSKVKVTNKDGSTIIVNVPVEVKDKIPWTDIKPVPPVSTVPIEIYQGDPLDYKKGMPDLPDDSKYEIIGEVKTEGGKEELVKPDPDLNLKIGNHLVKVKVTNKDGSSKTVTIKVIVKKYYINPPRVRVAYINNPNPKEKAEALDDLLRRLTTDPKVKNLFKGEEKNYLKYVKSTKNPSQEVLRVTLSDGQIFADFTYEEIFEEMESPVISKPSRQNGSLTINDIDPFADTLDIYTSNNEVTLGNNKRLTLKRTKKADTTTANNTNEPKTSTYRINGRFAVLSLMPRKAAGKATLGLPEPTWNPWDAPEGFKVVPTVKYYVKDDVKHRVEKITLIPLNDEAKGKLYGDDGFSSKIFAEAIATKTVTDSSRPSNKSETEIEKPEIEIESSTKINSDIPPDAVAGDNFNLIVEKDGKNKKIVKKLTEEDIRNKKITITLKEQLQNNDKVDAYITSKNLPLESAKDEEKITLTTPSKPDSNPSTGGGGGRGGSSKYKSDSDKSYKAEGKTETEERNDLTEKGIHRVYIFGYPDKTVRPLGNIKRSEVAAMIARIENLPMTDKSVPKFKNMKSSWYNTAINAVVKAGYMVGYPNGEFGANDNITRAEFALVVSHIDNKKGYRKGEFKDEIPKWAKEAVYREYSNGTLNGYPNGEFRPYNYITRAEVATILNNLKDRKVDRVGVEKVKEDKYFVDFKDNDKEKWYYYEMLEAINTHRYERDNIKKEEKWLEVYDIRKEIR